MAIAKQISNKTEWKPLINIFILPLIHSIRVKNESRNSLGPAVTTTLLRFCLFTRELHRLFSGETPRPFTSVRAINALTPDQALRRFP